MAIADFSKFERDGSSRIKRPLTCGGKLQLIITNNYHCNVRRAKLTGQQFFATVLSQNKQCSNNLHTFWTATTFDSLNLKI